MKQVAIVGIGMSADTLTAEGLREISQAEVLLGAPRLLAEFGHLGKPSFPEYAAAGVARILERSASRRFCVLVSGDVGFYSAAEGLLAALSGYETALVPGISSLCYFFARLGRPWQNAVTISRHGRGGNLVDAVRRSPETFVLTGGNAPELGRELTEAGFGNLNVQIGENLGMAGERLFCMPASGLAEAEIGKLAVLLVENPGWDDRIRAGIPDAEFVRGKVPMTKSEVRAVTLSRLGIRPGFICCDIGAGTGSVTVEMALAAYRGRVYALDRSEEAVALVRENCRAFRLGNVEAFAGTAPEALEKLPPADAAFIGGSSGKISDIMDALLHKNGGARIVVNAVTLETLHGAMKAFAAHDITPEIIQLGAARTKPAGSLHMLEAATPVFILSGGGNG